jgi:probable HAF family extracellular repeat protein
MSFIDLFRRSRRLSRRKDRSGRRRECRRPPLTVERLEERCLLTSYSITDLGTLGGNQSYAYGINNRGQVAGVADIPCGCIEHPFLWAGGVLHDLTPGQASARATGLNDLGQVVGKNTSGHPFLWSRASGMKDLGFTGIADKVNNRGDVVGQTGYPNHAFLWRDGHYLDLGTLGGGDDGSTATGINNRGEVVGQASGRAFLWTPGTGMEDLGSLDGNPGSTSDAAAINDRGQIVGTSFSYALGTSHAVYYSSSGVIDLGTLGGYSEAKALNNLGQVVGLSNGDAFLTDLQGGPMVDLNTLIPPDSGWVRLFEANGINDAGQIVGAGQLPGYDVIHAYLLTPNDTPSAPPLAVGLDLHPVQTVFSYPLFPDGRPLDRLPLRQVVAAWGAPDIPAEAGVLRRSMAVVAASARDRLAEQGWLDPLVDVLAE